MNEEKEKEKKNVPALLRIQATERVNPLDHGQQQSSRPKRRSSWLGRTALTVSILQQRSKGSHTSIEKKIGVSLISRSQGLGCGRRSGRVHVSNLSFRAPKPELSTARVGFFLIEYSPR